VRPWLFLAGLNGFLAVGAGAYGWHSLEAGEEAYRDVFMLGSQYHMWHALALLGVAWLASRGDSGWVVMVAGSAFMAGIVLFSGGLYAFGILGHVPIPHIAALGGWCLLLGWGALMWAALRMNSPQSSPPEAGQ